MAATFWAGSRIRQLNEKTHGGDTQINAMGFETALDVQPTDPVLQQIAFTAVHWVDTHKKGMTFGVLFGAALMTMFTLLQSLSIKGGFAHSAIGLLIGAPLGVRVNCAAPIAQGCGGRTDRNCAAEFGLPPDCCLPHPVYASANGSVRNTGRPVDLMIARSQFM